MLSAAITGPTAEKPLSREHYRELADAQLHFKKVRSAARVAAFNGWTIGILAALSAPFALFSVAGMLTTAGLSVIAYAEFRGRRRLLQFDPSAAVMLGWNQVGLLALVLGYSLWSLWAGFSDPSPLAAEVQAQPELGEALGSLEEFDSLYRSLIVAFYGLVMVLSILIQGLNAVHYFTRRKHVVACLQDTPEWVLDLERATSAD